jgi:pimeloyl-ACP methyl ester carboxylesterase
MQSVSDINDMKGKYILKSFNFVILYLVLAGIVLTNCPAQDFAFPSQEDVKRLKSGQFICNTVTFNWNGQDFETDFIIIAVPENRNSIDSRLIHLPIIKIKSKSETLREPVFTLAGGPGLPNIAINPPLWILENHDLVMVGFRGEDGSVILDCFEVIEYMKNTPGNPLSKNYLNGLGRAYFKGYNRMTNSDIDINGYNVIEVLDDVDQARQILGYERINLYGWSWGTRIGYLFGLRFPQSVKRAVLTGVNPPGHCYFDPATSDSLLFVWGELWKKDAKCLSKSKDILVTIRNVMNNLPKSWKGLPLIADQIRIGIFMSLYSINSAVQVFDAFVAAENGDYSGIAYLSFSFEMIKQAPINWGEAVAKAWSVDFDSNRDYYNDSMPEGGLLGSPVSKFQWSVLTPELWPMEMVTKEYRQLRRSNMETLLISGNLDIATPASNGAKLLRYLQNGHLVVIKNMGHLGDILNLQPNAYQNLVKQFLLTGQVDDSKFVNQPINFEPKETFQDMAKSFINKTKN